ncbi:hypothetical protein AHAS_Ahas04G0129300 [Arachis hypogaea]
MDKGWSSLPRRTDGYQYGKKFCSCSICNNFSWGRSDEVYNHLISKQFQRGCYTVWIHHSERISHMDSDSKKVKVQQEFVDDIDVLLNETFRHVRW